MHIWDWVVLGVYLTVLAASGWWLARREPAGTEEYFLANRRMPAWAVAFSIVASTLSVATFMGAPQQSYRGDLTYLSTNIGVVVAVAIVAGIFIPAYYRERVTTVYELLERRIGPGAKRTTSAAFMGGRLLASGARVFIAALPLATLLFGKERGEETWALVASVVLLCLAGVFCTLVGGISSVIWTDVIQTVVLIGSVLAAVVVLILKMPVGLGEVFASLSTAGPAGTSKLTVVRVGLDPRAGAWWGFDPRTPFTLLTAVLGWSLLNVAVLGTDHDLAQRMLTCRNAVKGARSVWASLVISLPLVMIFMILGLLLFAFYRRPWEGPGGSGADPVGSDRVLLVFMITELPPGVGGLMLAGLFAAGLGSLNSAVNAMAATFVKDFYAHWRPGRGERHYLVVGRWAVAGWGAAMAAMGIGCIWWSRAQGGTLIEFALGVMTYAYSGLLGVFLTALVTRRGSSASVAAALIAGATITTSLQPWAWDRWAGALWPAARGWAPASPWQMLLATAAAFVVCAAAPRRNVATA
ncbi:MAG: sodium:solute symporter [Phycisphaerae bacterium]|nr:sodium:solute symporter [Phycisphaerae bacterium]